MSAAIEADLCVIGAGSGGLSVAAGAAQLGAATVLIEHGRMGGDCLNTGCVPSKSLLAAARAASAVDGAGRFGVIAGAPTIDFGRVHDHVQSVIAAIAPHDSVERFEGLGVRVIQATARFLGPTTVAAGDAVISARRFVIATGSRAAVPPIPGLTELPFLTNESIFERKTGFGHLIVIGGGPIGVELAQAYRRLGAEVTLLEAGTLLPRADPELVDVVRHALVLEGIAVREGVAVRRVERGDHGVAAILGDQSRIEGTDLLIATGRRPNVEQLALGAAGIVLDSRGAIAVDARLRTSNRRVFAIGDVAGGPQFTHIAGYHAGIVIRNALFRWPAEVDYRALPWVIFSDPELAQVGLTEAQARETLGEIRVLRSPFADNDRARAEHTPAGLVKVIVRPDGRVVGASIVGAHAGEQLALWALAISRKLKISVIANLILPYPTLSEAGKRAAGSFYTPTLFSDRTRRLVRWLRWLG